MGVAVITRTSRDRTVALLAQRSALLHAEPVLLVDDHGAQRREVHPLRQQGVGADHDVDLPRRQALQHTGPDRSADAVRQQLDADLPLVEQTLRSRDGRTLEQLDDAHVVLLGQDLGGRHERTLVPPVHCGHERSDSDESLPGTDVSLEQPVHGHGRREVGEDLVDHAPLGIGELPGQVTQEPLQHRAVDDVGDACGRRLELPLGAHEGELDPEQLVEDESSARLGRLGHRLGSVDRLQCTGPVHEAVPGEHRGGNRVRDSPRLRPPEDLGHPPRDVVCGQTGLVRLRVDGDDAPGPVPDEVHQWVRHLQRPSVETGLAEDDDVAALGELPLAPGLVEEDALQPAGPVGDADGDQRPTVARPARGDLLHGAQDHALRVLAARLDRLGELTDRRLVRPVDVAPRVVHQQVEHRRHADLGERAGPLVRDPLEPGHRHLGQLGETDGSVRAHRRGPTGAGTTGLLHPHVVRIQRLAALVDLEVHVRAVLGEPLRDRGGRGLVGVGTLDQRHDLVIRGDEHVQQRNGGLDEPTCHDAHP